MATGAGDGKVSVKGWRWVLSSLAQTATVNNKPARCRIPIVDSIFWDADSAVAIEWIWANKHGQVVRKKTAHLSPTGIVHRFEGVREDNGNPKIIAVGFVGDKKTRLTFKQLQQYVTGEGHARSSLPAFDAIQLAIESKSRDSSALRNVYSLVKAGKVITKSLTVDRSGSEQPLESPHICHQLDLFTQRIVKHVEQVTSARILRLEVDYVIDSSDRIWLQTFHKVLVEEEEEIIAHEEEALSPVNNSNIVDESVLPPINGGLRPQSAPREENGGSAKAVGPRQLSAPTNFKSRPPSKEAAPDKRKLALSLQRPSADKHMRGVGSKGGRKKGGQITPLSVPSRGAGKTTSRLRSTGNPKTNTPLGFAQRMQNAQMRKKNKAKKKKKNLRPDSFEAKLDNASWEQLEKFRLQRQQKQESESANHQDSPPSRHVSPKGRKLGASPSTRTAGSRAESTKVTGPRQHKPSNSDRKLEEMVAQLIQQQGKQDQQQQALQQELEQLRERLASEMDAHQGLFGVFISDSLVSTTV